MPAGRTYTPIARQTLSTAASSVTFSSIPSSYTDLILVISGTCDTNDFCLMQYNSDTGSNYSITEIYADGGGPGSGRRSSQSNIYIGRGQTSQFVKIINIMNYSNTTTHKTNIERASSPSIDVNAIVGLWRSTAAINSIYIYRAAGNYSAGSTFTLYGIAAA